MRSCDQGESSGLMRVHGARANICAADKSQVIKPKVNQRELHGVTENANGPSGSQELVMGMRCSSLTSSRTQLSVNFMTHVPCEPDKGTGDEHPGDPCSLLWTTSCSRMRKLCSRCLPELWTPATAGQRRHLVTYSANTQTVTL